MEQTTGIRVYLPRECGVGDGYSNRVVVLQVLASGETKINSTDISREQLGKVMSQIYANRMEKVLRLVADRGAPYGAVVEAIGQVRSEVPHIAILLVTKDAPDAVWRACISSQDIRPEDREGP